jgi:hypothetical protein
LFDNGTAEKIPALGFPTFRNGRISRQKAKSTVASSLKHVLSFTEMKPVVVVGKYFPETK